MDHDQNLVESFFNDPEFNLQQGLVIWDQLEKQLAKYKALEMQARKAIFNKAWPSWKVGVNNYPLDNGYVLKGTGKINYTVDKTMFPVVSEGLKSMGLTIDPFLAVRYELAVGPYNAVVKDEQQNQTVGTVLRQMITSSTGAPTLEIVKSKSK